MSVCTFFGHSDCPDSISPILEDELINLIKNYSVDTFYVGTHGRFDRIVLGTLESLSLSFPDISYNVVLAYLPVYGFQNTDYTHSILPDDIENIHPRFAISHRNRWMIDRSDYAVTYVTHSWGGAARFAELAKRKKLTVINLADTLF